VACIRGDEWKVKIMLPRNRGGVASDIEGTRKALSERDIVNAINMKSEVGMTPLHYAVINDHKTIANILMQNGADPRIETEIGLTAADYARANATPESRKLAQSCEDFAVTLVKIEVRNHFACILRMPPPPRPSPVPARAFNG